MLRYLSESLAVDEDEEGESGSENEVLENGTSARRRARASYENTTSEEEEDEEEGEEEDSDLEDDEDDEDAYFSGETEDETDEGESEDDEDDEDEEELSTQNVQRNAKTNIKIDSNQLREDEEDDEDDDEYEEEDEEDSEEEDDDDDDEGEDVEQNDDARRDTTVTGKAYESASIVSSASTEKALVPANNEKQIQQAQDNAVGEEKAVAIYKDDSNSSKALTIKDPEDQSQIVPASSASSRFSRFKNMASSVITTGKNASSSALAKISDEDAQVDVVDDEADGDEKGEDIKEDELDNDIDEDVFGAHDLLTLNHLHINHIRTLCTMEKIPSGGSKAQLMVKLQNKLKTELPALWTKWVCGEDSNVVGMSSDRLASANGGSGVVVGPRRTDGAVCVYNNMIYYHGGGFNGHAMNSMVRRDPETSIWYLVQPINKNLNAEFKAAQTSEIVARDVKAYTGPSARRFHTAVTYNDKLWVYGGTGDTSSPLSDMHCYDFRDNFWVKEEYLDDDIDEDKPGTSESHKTLPTIVKKRKKGVKAPRRYYHQAIMYKNAMIVFGGIDEKHRFSNEVYSYHFDEGRWEHWKTSGSKPMASGVFSATLWKSNMYTICWSQKNGTLQMSKLNLRTKRWTSFNIKNHMERNLNFHNNFRSAYSSASHSKFWVVHGGKDNSGKYLNDTYSYDFVLQTWSKVEAEGYAGVARAHHSLVNVGSGIGSAAELFIVAGKGTARSKDQRADSAAPALKDEYMTVAPLPPPATHVTTNSSLIDMLKQYCGADSVGYESVPLSDCVIICKNEEMQAHRIVLAAQSPVFADFFSPGTIEYETGQVEIEGFDVGTVQSLLNHMYGRPEKLAFGPHVIQLFMLANEVKMPELRATCEQVLVSGVQPKNAAQLMHLAEAYKSSYLRDACLKVTAEGMQDVVQSDAYRDLIEKRPDLVQQYTNSALERLKTEQERLAEQKQALEKLITEERSLMADKKAILSLSENGNSKGAAQWKKISAKRVELLAKAGTSIKSASPQDRTEFAKNVFLNMNVQTKGERDKVLSKTSKTSPVIALSTMKRKEEISKARSAARKRQESKVISYIPEEK